VALNSRGPLIAFLLGAIFLSIFLLRKQKKRAIILLLPYTVFLFLILPKHYIFRHFLLFNTESTSLGVRIELWKVVLDHFEDWFLQGAGLFGFANYIEAKSIFGAYPHNIFLDIFAHCGIFGLFVFIWLIGYFFYKGFKLSKLQQDRSFQILIISSLAGLFVFIVNSLFSWSLINSRAMWFFGGLILSLVRIRRKMEFNEKQEKIKTIN